MKALATLALAVVSLVGQTGRSTAHAQEGAWWAYSAPDKSFSVELPVPLRRVMSFEGEHGANLEPDQKILWASCYAAIETTPKDSRFGIIVINGKSKFFRSQPRDEVLKYLSVVLIGDDDEPEPTSEAAAHTNGLAGREYVYAKERQFFAGGSTGELFTRGRIFDTGGKVYVVVFRGRKAADLRSPGAERFLNSFRLRNRDAEV